MPMDHLAEVQLKRRITSIIDINIVHDNALTSSRSINPVCLKSYSLNATEKENRKREDRMEKKEKKGVWRRGGGVV